MNSSQTIPRRCDSVDHPPTQPADHEHPARGRPITRYGPRERRPEASYVAVIPAMLDATCSTHRLSTLARQVFRRVLLDADWRGEHQVADFRTVTSWAEHVGLGTDSARRTLPNALAELVAAKLVTYEPATRGGSDARLCVAPAAYGHHVQQRNGERLEWSVWMRPRRLDSFADVHGLAWRPRALLEDLLALADPNTHTLAAWPRRELAAQLGLGYRTLVALLEDLAETGAVATNDAGRLEVVAYEQLVRLAPEPAPALSDRAFSLSERATSVVETRERPAISPPVLGTQLPNPSGERPTGAETTKGKERRSSRSVERTTATIAGAIPVEHRKRLRAQLADRSQRGGMHTLARRFDELASLVGHREALHQISAGWEPDVRSPLAFAIGRAGLRLTSEHERTAIAVEADEDRRGRATEMAKSLARTDGLDDSERHEELERRLTQAGLLDLLEVAAGELATVRPASSPTAPPAHGAAAHGIAAAKAASAAAAAARDDGSPRAEQSSIASVPPTGHRSKIAELRGVLVAAAR